MNILPIGILSALLTFSLSSNAQTTAGAGAAVPQTAPDAGAIIMPPATDPGLIKRPPDNVDPGAIARPPANVDPGAVETPPTDANPRGTDDNRGGAGRSNDGGPIRPEGEIKRNTPTSM